MPLIDDTAHAFMPYPPAPVPHAGTGPLAGLTFAVKDLFDVAGYPTSGGQPLLLAMSGIKTRTAPTVQRLLDAGARFVGKTVTDELAFSMNGNNAHFGAPLNGAAPDRISGGSSSGSASAVSSRLADFALGTDTGGSVRAPASHCGLVGLRPTHGRVSLSGCLDWGRPAIHRLSDVLWHPELRARFAEPQPASAARRASGARGARRASGSCGTSITGGTCRSCGTCLTCCSCGSCRSCGT